MIDIKSTSNITRFSTPINEGSKRKYTLMKEDYITLKFSVENPVYFKLGDYVDESFGLFELVDLCKPTINETTGAYDYELRLDAYYWKWKNKKFFYSPEVGGSEAGWNLTAPLDVHMNVFLRNLESLGYAHKDGAFSFEIDPTVELSSKLVSYDNTNLIDALTRIAETWEGEWWIIGSKIHFGRCEFGEPVDFDLSSNVSSMSRSDSKTSYATRVYAFGSTRNIPSTYRKNLIFDVKEVSGRNISDTSRKLESKFFPESAKIEAPKIQVTFNHDPGQGYFTANPATYTKDWSIANSLNAGTYKIKPKKLTVSGMKGGAGVYFITYKATLSLLYSVNGEEKSILLQSKEGKADEIKYEAGFTECSFTIEKDASNCRLSINTSITFFGSDVNVAFWIRCDAVVQCIYYAANIPITFLSGANKGRTFNAVFNPDFITGDAANIIRLPEGITASKGDTYTIDNIIRSKVPSNYFSKSTTELTVEGVVTNRLMLPLGTKCVNAYEGMAQEEAIEDIVIFEDIYPRRVGTMEEVPPPHKHKKVIKENGKETVTEEWEAYRFIDKKFIFSKDYKFPDKDLEIIFQSGALNGMKFVVAFNPFEEGIDKEAQPEKNPDGTWNAKAQVFEIMRNQDYGRYLPDSIAFPRGKGLNPDGTAYEGDKYILSGFDPEFVLDTMIPEAEQELLEKAQEYVDKSKIDPSTYDCKMMSTYIHNNEKVKLFDIGDRVNLINKAYFDNGRQSRIIGFEYPLDIPYDSPIYTVGETAAYSRIGALEEKVDSLTYQGQTYTGSAGGGGGGSSVYIIGKNDKTSPSDSKVFSSLRTLSEILANNEELLKKVLRKDQPEQTEHLLELLGGAVVRGGIDTDSITVGDYVSGLLGSGGCFKVNAETGKSYFEVDELFVRMKAIFTELIISKLSHVGGNVILSPARMTCIKVEEQATAYRCYFKATDGEKTITNDFAIDDQATAMEFNIKEGVHEGVANLHYWRLVTAIGDDYIDLSKTDCDSGGGVPAVGDDICQLGNRMDKSRQGAIILSSYGSGSPSIIIYAGINSFSYAGKEVIGFDYDTASGKARMRVYGESYIGANDKSSYIEYTEKDGVDIKAKLHIQPGSTGWEDLEGLPEGIQEAANSVVNGLEFGKNNLLRNSGFTGDYLSASLKESTDLDSTSELFSPSLKYWDVTNAVAHDSDLSESGKEVVLANGGMNQTLYYKTLAEESYIFSFRGKGASITFSCGGYTETVALSATYTRYVRKFKTLSIGSIFSISAASGTLCELQLERGTVPSAWGASMMDNTSELAHYQSLQYISDAIKNGSVDILGGLILAAQLQLGNYKDGKMQQVTSGVSGIYNDGDDVAFWAGGTFEQAINAVIKYKDNPNYVPTEEELKGMANFVATHGGRAILNDVILRGYIYAIGGIVGGWEVTTDSIQSLEYETTIEGAIYKNRTKFNNNGTITGNLLNILYSSGFIKSTHYGKNVIEWVENIVSIPMVYKTPFSPGEGISTSVGSTSISPTIINELKTYGNSNHHIDPIGESKDTNGYTYYSLPNDLSYDGVTLRLHIDKYYGNSNNSWKNHNCYLVYYKTGDIPSYGDTTGNKTLKSFKGKITEDKLPLLRGGMVVLTAVAELCADGSRNKEITWFVEMTC